VSSGSIGPADLRVGDIIVVTDLGPWRLLVKRLPHKANLDGRGVRVQIAEGPDRGETRDISIPWSAAVQRFAEL
jgi:hypothetical protein